MRNATPMATADVVSNIDQSKAVVCGIDNAGMSMVLSILSNMYSNGSEAVVREYSSNALDSHVAVGNSEPILVTLPTALRPNFVVQDFGLGLSKDEIVRFYSQYGASTKRETNDQIGAFGIGSKSAFTVGTQFLVTGVKDGMRTIALFALNSEAIPTVNILAHHATDEPNGVTVDVGVDNVGEVRAAAGRIFKGWEPGTVLVDGEPPASYLDGAESLGHGLYTAKRANSYDPPLVLVMGGVSYPLIESLARSLGVSDLYSSLAKISSLKIYHYIAIGEVDITPSREELRSTDKTRDTVEATFLEITRAILVKSKAEVEEAPSLMHAYVAYAEAASTYGELAVQADYYWNGQKLSLREVVKPASWITFVKETDWGSKYNFKVKRVEGAEIYSRNANSLPVFITGVTDKTIGKVRLYLKRWMYSSGNYSVIAIPDDAGQEGWFVYGSNSPFKILSLDEFVTEAKAVETPGFANGKRKEVAYFSHKITLDPLTQLVEDEPGHMTGKEITDAGLPVYYMQVKRDGERWNTGYNRFHCLKNQMGNCIVVHVLTRQPEDKFLQRVPGAKRLVPHLRDLAQEEVKKITKEQMDAYILSQTAGYHADQFERRLQARFSDITNQKMRDRLAVGMNNQTIRTADDKTMANHVVAVYQAASKTLPSAYEGWDDFLIENFPLLSGLGYVINRSEVFLDHAVEYINSH